MSWNWVIIGLLLNAYEVLTQDGLGESISLTSTAARSSGVRYEVCAEEEVLFPWKLPDFNESSTDILVIQIQRQVLFNVVLMKEHGEELQLDPNFTLVDGYFTLLSAQTYHTGDYKVKPLNDAFPTVLLHVHDQSDCDENLKRRLFYPFLVHSDTGYTIVSEAEGLVNLTVPDSIHILLYMPGETPPARCKLEVIGDVDSHALDIPEDTYGSPLHPKYCSQTIAVNLPGNYTVKVSLTHPHYKVETWFITIEALEGVKEDSQFELKLKEYGIAVGVLAGVLGSILIMVVVLFFILIFKPQSIVSCIKKTMLQIDKEQVALEDSSRRRTSAGSTQQDEISTEKSSMLHREEVECKSNSGDPANDETSS